MHWNWFRSSYTEGVGGGARFLRRSVTLQQNLLPTLLKVHTLSQCHFYTLLNSFLKTVNMDTYFFMERWRAYGTK
jgi:hypothetical protein